MEFELQWLSDPEIFQVNTLPPVSDHLIYANMQQAESEQSSLVRSLDGEWQAHFAMNPSDAPDQLLKDSSMDGTLRAITVPGEFQLQNPEWDPPHYVNVQYPWDGHEELAPGQVSSVYNPTVTAVRLFTLTEQDLQAARIVLTFEGVEAAVAVYMNSHFIGYSEDSFTPHRFDVTQAVHAGENRLVARVFKRCTGVWMEDQDFWRFSGIHRSVTLTFEPQSHLNDLFVRTLLQQQYTKAVLQTDMNISRPVGTVQLTLSAPDGTILLQDTLPSGETLAFHKEVPNVKLWSAEEPNLYLLTIMLKNAEGNIVEVARTEVGFRQFEMIDKIMCLNGKRIVFHGVNRHEFDCERGRVMTPELLMRDMHDMKCMNINAIRTCHYPNTSLFYRLCDRYGFYVIDETNIETHGTWAPYPYEEAIAKALPGDKPEWQQAVLARGRAMQERDKNHPCILMWSCGNESFGGLDLFNLSQMFRNRDHTRLVHYEGVANDPRYPDTTDVFSRMYFKVADIENYLSNDPQKPFINCEYTHAMGNSCGGMLHYTALESKYPMYQGGFIWDYVDQGLLVTAPNGQPRLAYGGDFGDRPTDRHFNTNGILLGDRSSTGKVQEIAHLYRDVDIVPDETGVTLRSMRNYAPVSGYILQWDTLINGVPAQRGIADVPDIAPGESVYIPLPINKTDDETILTARLCTKDQTDLVEKDTCISAGQSIFGKRLQEEKIHMPSALIQGPSNIGFRGKDYGALLARNEGLISFRDAAGKETLLHAPQLSLFRAPTDNDRGNQDALQQGVYIALSLSSGISSCSVSGASVCFTYTNPLLPGLTIPVTFTALENAVDVTVTWPGMKDLPDLPCLGLQLLMDSRLNRINYLGLGPDECYTDRCSGALMGWHSYAVKDGWVHYAKPQESGNRMGVRVFHLVDDDGHGISITGNELQISAQPYAPEQLMSVWHPDELQGSCRTVLNIAAFRQGIGGDDSWGAPVLPQYKYPADREYTLHFQIRSI